MASEQALPPQVAGLWPAPAEVSTARSSREGATSYFVVPSLRRPRLLVPTDVRGADRMFARHGGSRVDKAARSAWRRAHRSGVASRLPLSRLAVIPEPDGIEAYLSDALGRSVRMGVLLGPPRANLKPVVQIFSDGGETVAFAKLGLTPLTAKLLATEAAALAMLGERTTTTFTAPALLHHGSWKGTPILVQQALPLAQSHRTPTAPPLEVMVEIAGLEGIVERPLGQREFLDGVRPAGDAQWHGLDLSPFFRLYERLADVESCAFGCWHGDFGPWNMGTDGRRTEVWDWERFSSDVPVGFDAAHYQTQRGVATQTEPAEAWELITTDVAAVLRACDLDVAGAEIAAAAYLLAICARYRLDADSGPTPKLKRRLTWLGRVSDLALERLKEPTP